MIDKDNSTFIHSIAGADPKKLADENLVLAYERTWLAAERTFLSWIRTGLTGVAGGLAVARLILFQTLEHQRIANLVGQFLIIWGVIVFIFAFLSYRRTCQNLAHTRSYKDNLWPSALIISSLTILALTLFWILR